MKKKAIVVSLLLCAIGLSAFAEVGTYFKGALGYSYRWGLDWTTTIKAEGYEETWIWSDMWGEDYPGVDRQLGVAIPTFGIEPWRGSGNAFLRGLSFEVSVSLGLGKASMSEDYQEYPYDYTVTENYGLSYILDPKVMAVYTYRAGIVAPYIGVGVSVPIIFIPDFGGNEYDYSDDGTETIMETSAFKIGVNGNVMAGVGFQVTESIMPVFEVEFGFGMTGMQIDAHAGIVYRFGM